MKKGAMFGLDARIALAIFGAISVISGASLYSAIQSTKAEQSRQNLEELNKSVIQYYLDHNKRLVLNNTGSGYYEIGNLVENLYNSNLWKGPYIEYNKGSDSLSLNASNIIGFSTDINRYMQLIKGKSSTWNTSPSCSNFNDCGQWFLIRSSTVNETNRNEAYAKYKSLDDLVDSNDGELAGKVRWREPILNNYYLYYKGPLEYYN